jgi:acyl-CoA synthetase (AMP-forming)/AMP-acid ligase II
MIRLLESAAAASPDQIAVVTPEGSASYAGLLADARCVASALHRRGINRFAIVEHDAGWVIRLLAGAARVEAEPCQYQPDTPAAELAEQLDAHGHTVVVSRRTDLDERFDVVHPDGLTAAEAVELRDPDSQPLLIRTTGTTGAPKAARHDWRVLARTVAGLRPRPDQRWLLAYAPHQFAGIQVLLHVMACQATLVAPFPRQPRDGLQALVDEAVTCVSATPTYWRFLLTEAASRKVDLPPLEQITLGGEASPPDLLEALKSSFPTARISQVYASTELGSIASVRDGRPGFALDSVYGGANPTSNLKIVDGELWVRASAGMVGSEADEWHATGDLVEVEGDRVVFRGRTSEVINVGGVKVHPLPIENKVAALDGVAAVRVLGRPNALTGAVVAVEVVPWGEPDEVGLEDLRQSIKASVADLPRAWHPRSIAFVESIGTQGGKTVRRTEA